MPVHKVPAPRFPRIREIRLDPGKRTQGAQRAELHCASEMTALFACWKANSIENPQCKAAAEALMKCRSVKDTSKDVSNSLNSDLNRLLHMK